MAVLDRASAAAPARARKEPLEINVPGVRMATPGETWRTFDAEAQRELGMSGLAFMATWQRGEFAGREDELPVARVLILMPGAR